MNILYISYWGINEGLSRSTVIPNVQILASFERINRIYLITIERNADLEPETIDPKISHIPIHSKSYSLPFLDKLINFFNIPRLLHKLIIQNSIEKILARGAPAGSIAYLLWKRSKIPFYVESFEPHSTYMLESNVWKRWDPRYIYQRKWELKTTQNAVGIITVSEGYKIKLEKIVTNKTIMSAPCAVAAKLFSFSNKDRQRIREIFKIEKNTVIGIYVGKFGDIYYNQKAFELFKIAYDFFYRSFFLIILSNESAQSVENKLIKSKFPLSNVFIENVEHTEVPAYLSASDFGFATIKKSPSKRYCSPIKIGEYWANGLPVLLTEGVGDESQFIEEENGGALFDIYNPIPGLSKIKAILRNKNHRAEIPELARKYRSFEKTREAYQTLIINN